MRGRTRCRSVNMLAPRMVISPAVGTSTPSNIDRVVVFPAPFPPRSPTMVPRSTVNEMFLTAMVPL